jgi:hypothetical protein
MLYLAGCSRGRCRELDLRQRIHNVLLLERDAGGKELCPERRLARQFQRLLTVQYALRMLELECVQLAELLEQCTSEFVVRRICRRPPNRPPNQLSAHTAALGPVGHMRDGARRV